MPDFLNFQGRSAVVTGGASGIGLAVALALAERGVSVHAFDLASGVPPSDLDIRFHRVDISDPGAVQEVVQGLPHPITFLVNNAGITRDRTTVKMTDAEWSSVISVNLTGAFYVTRALAPGMLAGGNGRIVNIASINGLRGKFGQANYSASKAGLIGLTKTWAREFGSKGVTVNAIAPGMVMTDMALSLSGEVLEKARTERVLPRDVLPSDVANAVLFLLSDAARCITGEVLRVDAGQCI